MSDQHSAMSEPLVFDFFEKAGGRWRESKNNRFWMRTGSSGPDSWAVLYPALDRREKRRVRVRNEFCRTEEIHEFLIDIQFDVSDTVSDILDVIPDPPRKQGHRGALDGGISQ